MGPPVPGGVAVRDHWCPFLTELLLRWLYHHAGTRTRPSFTFTAAGVSILRGWSHKNFFKLRLVASLYLHSTESERQEQDSNLKTPYRVR